MTIAGQRPAHPQGARPIRMPLTRCQLCNRELALGPGDHGATTVALNCLGRF
jgi:hypothetical protein